MSKHTAVCLLKSLLSAAGISLILDRNLVSIIPALIFAACFYLYRPDAPHGERDRAADVCAALFALFLTLGNIDLYRAKGAAAGLLIALTVFSGSFFFLDWLTGRLYSGYDALSSRAVRRSVLSTGAVFALSFVFLLLIYVPYWLTFLPGVMTPDSFWQAEQILGLAPLSNHHPIAHTYTVKALIYIAQLLGSPDISLSYGFVSLVQLIFMCLCFSLTTAFLYKRTRSLPVAALCLAFYGFVAYNPTYSVTLWKDIPHAGITLILLLLLFRRCEDVSAGRSSASVLTGIFVFGCLFCLFRSNGLYAFLFWFVIVLIFFKQLRDRALILVSFAVAAVSIVITGPVYDRMGVEEASISESLSVPMQQIAYVVSNEFPLTDEEYELLDKVIDVEQIPSNYVPYLADDIKVLFRAHGSEAYFREHASDYFRLWLEIGLRYPKEYLTAYVYQTCGFWFPDYDYWVLVSYGMPENEAGVQYVDLLSDDGKRIVLGADSYTKYRDIPLYASLWAVGTFAWIMLFMLIYVLSKKMFRLAILLYALPLGIWLTLLASTPVSAEFRYFYSVVVSSPLLIFAPLADVRRALYSSSGGKA